jgi:Kef-type K+ transport system membrane component KefB
MDRLSSHEVVVMLLSVGILLTAAKALGEVAKRFKQPSVIGEILAGVLLGPTVFGSLAPGLNGYLFPSSGPNALVLNGLATLAISLFLLVAGMEVDLSAIWRRGKSAFLVGAAGVVFPFALGFFLAWFAPGSFHADPGSNPLIFALFIAVALSITALPVIVRILMDLRLYHSDIGMIIVAAAVFDDIAGWIVFGTILGMMGASSGNGLGVVPLILLTLSFTALMLTVGRWLIHRILGWLLNRTTWSVGILGFSLSLGLFGAALTEWMGIHAIFGSFLVGVAIGDSAHLKKQTRSTISHFVAFIFAPLFFATIGLRVDFAAHFNGLLVLTLLAVILVGKIPACALGARVSGLPWRESWAIGFGMIAKGVMGIILGLIALQNRVINETLFVAIIITSLLTSMMSGPLMQRVLKRNGDASDSEMQS